MKNLLFILIIPLVFGAKAATAADVKLVALPGGKASDAPTTGIFADVRHVIALSLQIRNPYLKVRLESLFRSHIKDHLQNEFTARAVGRALINTYYEALPQGHYNVTARSIYLMAWILSVSKEFPETAMESFYSAISRHKSNNRESFSNADPKAGSNFVDYMDRLAGALNHVGPLDFSDLRPLAEDLNFLLERSFASDLQRRIDDTLFPFLKLHPGPEMVVEGLVNRLSHYRSEDEAGIERTDEFNRTATTLVLLMDPKYALQDEIVETLNVSLNAKNKGTGQVSLEGLSAEKKIAKIRTLFYPEVFCSNLLE